MLPIKSLFSSPLNALWQKTVSTQGQWGRETDRGMLEEVHWLMPFCHNSAYWFVFRRGKVISELLWSSCSVESWYYAKFCTAACSDQWMMFDIFPSSISNERFAVNIVLGLFKLYWPFMMMDAMKYCNKTFHTVRQSSYGKRQICCNPLDNCV